MEVQSPPPCPRTVTIRRNPYRKARATPSSTIPLPLPLSSPSISNDLPSFPIQDILSIEIPERTKEADSSLSEDPKKPSSESLKVFLRIRPLAVQKAKQKDGKYGGDEVKNAWPKNPKSKSSPKKKVKKRSEICVAVNGLHSVIVSPPQSLQDTKRVKSEVYEGFSHVFSAESSQSEVYEKMVNPLVEDFLRGKSGMLAALGPSGSGKTHTVFGCSREPGMIPLALRRIFSQHESNGTLLSRELYLSMFEICSEKGKSERISDLLREGMDLYMQQSAIKGLQEVIIADAQQAECLIAGGLLKRATAMTNSNSQSSRSQCIINIRCRLKKIDGDVKDESSSPVLTIVDLAGAEREKKTGNQGLRLLESNFINNTSMVFGLCLRSLLEHQKNPKKPLQKCFQNSLLTRYLRAYLEGKKRMALVVTVKPGEEDYLDTSNMLKQASPYAQIKFTSTEKPGNIISTKRPIQTFSRAEQTKRMKFSGLEAYVIDEKRNDSYQQLTTKESTTEKVEEGNLTEVLLQSEELISSEVIGGTNLKVDPTELAKRNREHQIMQNFAKALWNVLKQYKNNLEMAESEICCLRDNLTSEKKRCSELESEVKELKCRPSYWKGASAEVSIIEVDDLGDNHSPDFDEYQWSETHEVKGQNPVFAPCTVSSCFKEDHYQHTGQQVENFPVHNNSMEDVRNSKDLGEVDTCANAGPTGVWVSSLTPANHICEEASTIAGSGKDIQDLKDSPEEDHSSVSNARDFLVLEDIGRDDACKENEERGENDVAISVSTTSDSVVSSPSSTIISSSDDSFAAETDQLPKKDCEKEQHPQVAVMPEDDVSFAQGCKDCNAPDISPKLHARSIPQNTEKPRRRLLPASSTLLKDIGSLALEGENDKPKGVRGEKKVAVDMRNKTKGSISLLRLLRTDLDL